MSTSTYELASAVNKYMPSSDHETCDGYFLIVDGEIAVHAFQKNIFDDIKGNGRGYEVQLLPEDSRLYSGNATLPAIAPNCPDSIGSLGHDSVESIVPLSEGLDLTVDFRKIYE